MGKGGGGGVTSLCNKGTAPQQFLVLLLYRINMSEDYVLYQHRVVNYKGGNFIQVNFSYYIFSLNNSLGDMSRF